MTLLVAALVAAASAPALKAEATFDNPPVGIAASPKSGRVFLAFSRAIDKDEPISVGELKSGKAVPFPPGFQQEKGEPGDDRLLAVQAMTVDAKDRLWILDCAKVGQESVAPGAPKLVAVDLKTSKAVQTIHFPPAVAGPTSFLNDLVVDLKAGRIYLTDASFEGPNGLVVVDLASGRSWRKLDDDPATKPAPGLTATVENQPLVMKAGKMPGKPFAAGADGIALSANGKQLFFSPLTSHHLYGVQTEGLAAESGAAKVEDLGDKGFAADGMLGDAQGRTWSTDYENNAIRRRDAAGKWEIIAQDPRLLWPDSMALTSRGKLWFTATQIERGEIARGKDERQKPFTLWSIQTDARPLLR